MTAITIVLIGLFPAGIRLLKMVRAHAYVYGYSASGDTVAADTSSLPSAQAVPILMYHGVIEHGPAGPNTSRENFIAQMEMLKRNGFQTISVHEYDLFRQGKFILPAKPIILTFDDGRRDSFYTVDEVLKKLGFKATLFVATIKAIIGDPFYLGWNELADVQATGRWEIQAHGRKSHESVVLDAQGHTGRFLVSRAFSATGGLESVEQYKQRVDEDYRNGIADLHEHLGISAHYLAVPLNHYGVADVSNYEGAFDYNLELTRRYFSLAFVEALSDSDQAFESFYNYIDSDPYQLKRLEVKSMSAASLQSTLEHFAPKPPSLTMTPSDISKSFLQNTQLLYGRLETNSESGLAGITLKPSDGTNSGRMLFGDWGWSNYSIRASIVRQRGRSVSVIAYYSDEENYISLDWTDTSLRLVEVKGGTERELAWYGPWENRGEAEVVLRIQDGHVSAYFSGIPLAREIPIRLTRGAAGFGVWDPKVTAQSTVTQLEIRDIGNR